MICDFAEYYHIYDYTGLSPITVATLCFGLREESRIKMAISGQKITMTQMLLARIADDLAFQSWTKTKDGQKNRNRPASILRTLMEGEKEKECNGYASGEDFERAWREITGDTNNG